ncbi:molybdopterin-binding protein [Sphingomonas psychrotolerans]|uniref:Molybdopterin-binding protein n=1 Tax=Sphingomonas psychrotolerans TaxID=1327635 RepID=A0A2K8MIY4_9SPHN|nr:molybdopterin-binding protein [Sphingomonas psychrotolerans]ATY33848.1 molybdopterin-binding protein [Sphingomonas psychrotolerans]
MISRRTLLIGTGASLLPGCDSLTDSPALLSAEEAHLFLQRSITGRAALARQFRPDQRSPIFRVNGTANPNTPEYNALAANRFADWRLRVDGLVARPLSLSLAQIRSLPQRAQITRHDCVEGWSAIGKWQGPRLETVLQLAGIRDTARYIVFHCADRFGGTPYYESIDLVDAFHPQTILAWAMNDAPLNVGHGAPLRLRVERQLGYKHAKYVMRIEAVASLAGTGAGKGGYWEDSNGYEWYAGI